MLNFKKVRKINKLGSFFHKLAIIFLFFLRNCYDDHDA